MDDAGATLRRRNRVLEGVNRLFREALSAGSEEELGRLCLAVAEDVTGAGMGFIGGLNAATGRFDELAVSDRGWAAFAMDDPAFPRGVPPTGVALRGLFGRVLNGGETLIVNEPATHPDRIGTPAGHPPLDNFMGVPLTRGGHTVGMLGLANRPGGFGAEERAAAEELAPAILHAMRSKRDEAALARSELKYRSVFAAIDEGFCVIEMIRGAGGEAVDYRFVEVNPAFQRHTGLVDVVGRTGSEVTPGTERAWLDVFGGIAASGDSRRFQDYHAATHRWYDVYASRLDGPAGLVCIVFTDITERRRAEHVLRESEERQTFMLELGDAMRRQQDAHGVVAAGARMLGERLNASRVVFAEIDDEAGVAHIMPGWTATGASVHPATLRLADFGGPLLDELRAGQVVRYDDVGEPPYPRADLAALAAIDIRAGLSVPLLVGGRFVVNLNVHQHEPRRWTDAEVALATETAERMWAAVQRVRAEEALRASEEQQRLILELVPALLWWADPQGDAVAVNRRWQAYTGQSEAETQNFGWLAAIHPDDLAATRAAFEHAFATGEPIERQQRIHKGDDGYRWHLVRHVPVRDTHGATTHWFGAAVDIHDLHELQHRQQLLLAELQHRVRNVLAVVRSVFSRTIEAGGDLEDIADHFKGRLDSLARTQVVVTRSPSGLVDLENLIRDELLSVGAGDSPSLVIEGPEVLLDPASAETMGLAIHELITNALKYGALKVRGATLTISWRTDMVYGQPRRAVLTWTEQGVPAIPLRPSRFGFGRELIEEALPYRLGADTKLEFRGGGVCCTISLPLPDQGASAATGEASEFDSDREADREAYLDR